jgi:hypothetical protein
METPPLLEEQLLLFIKALTQFLALLRSLSRAALEIKLKRPLVEKRLVLSQVKLLAQLLAWNCVRLPPPPPPPP